MRSLLSLDALLCSAVLECDTGKVFELLIELGICGADECDGEGDNTGEKDSGGDVEFEREGGGVLYLDDQG